MTCPGCRSPVTVQGSDEGTHYYQPERPALPGEARCPVCGGAEVPAEGEKAAGGLPGAFSVHRDE
jgi:hypothetical protein